MKKKLLLLFTTLCACFTLAFGFAACNDAASDTGTSQSSSQHSSDPAEDYFSEGLEYTLSNDETYYTVSGIGTCTDTDISIPSTYNGLPVTAIGDYAFNCCSSLTSITIPDSVNSIGKEAFAYCRSLTSITIPDSVTFIGDFAFDYCSSLTYSIKGGLKYLGNENNSYLYLAGAETTDITTATIENGCKFIGDSAFRGCSSLTSVTIPDNVTSIGKGAFSGCSSLTSITIPDSVTFIGDFAFDYCSSLTYTIKGGLKYLGNENNPYLYLIDTETTDITTATIENGCKVIGGYAFSRCSSLTSITIPDSVTSIGEAAFDYCSSLTSITIPDGVTSIDERAFCECSSLTSVTIPDGVTSIDENTFYGCSKLTSITIPDSITSIGRHAFSGCSSLTSITIPDGVTSIDENTFYGCYRLVEVYNKSSLEITAGSTSYGYIGYYAKNVYTPTNGTSKLSTDSDGYIIYTDGADKILIGYTGNETELTLPSVITGIRRYAFYNCSGLTSVTIPDSVTSIGYLAFVYCSNLTSITIPESVTSIGDYMFSGCSSLTYNVKDGLNYLGNTNTPYLYLAGTTSKDITTATIENGCRFIGYCAFDYCSSLTSITIPDSVTSIGAEAFYECSSLTNITIPDSVTYIGDYMFSDCSSLTYNVKGGLNYLGNENNPYLYLAGPTSTDITTATIDNGCRFIDSNAFEGCDGLTSIAIPDGVTSIGEDAFQYCSNLTSITIPDSVTSIGEWAFCGCSSLTNITIGNSVVSIGDYAFWDCSSLTSVYYTGTAEEWSAISIYANNDYLTSATRYYYIEKEEYVPDDGGNYWHYDENGDIVIWNE